MSTIAWDGKMLAADCKMSSGNLQEVCSKIRLLPDGTILAFAGQIAEGIALANWYEDGADKSAYPPFQNDNNRYTQLIVVKPDGSVWEYEQPNVPIPILGTIGAWGSGRAYALGAMQMGADAVQAVEIANQFDPGSGFGVESYEVGNAGN